MAKSYQLVAWTHKGKVKMIPSLVAQLAEPYVRLIQEVEAEDQAWGEEAETEQLLRQSRAYEALGQFFLRVDYWEDAFLQFYKAATAVTNCTDRRWIDAGDGYILYAPLEHRFFAMYGRCCRIAREHPGIKESVQWWRLHCEWRVVTMMERFWDAEFDEGLQTAKAWRFGMN